MSKEAMKLAREAGIRDCTCNGALGCLERFASLVRADERARMAEQPAQQEPVAWARNLTDPQPHCVTALKYMSVADTDAGVQYTPLYTSPQAQRTWVGLTDEEVKECFESVPTQDCQNYEHWRSLCARNIETKLREKNT